MRRHSSRARCRARPVSSHPPAGLLPDVPAATVVVVAQPVGMPARRRLRRSASSFGASASAETSSSTRAMPRSSAVSSAAAPPCSRRSFASVPASGGIGHHDATTLGLQPLTAARWAARMPAPLSSWSAKTIDLGDVVRDLHPLQALRRQRRPRPAARGDRCRGARARFRCLRRGSAAGLRRPRPRRTAPPEA